MSEVTERLVKRYFYNGKSYGTRLAAYKKQAKEALMTEVFGPIQDVTVIRAVNPFTGEEASYTYQTRPGFEAMDTAVSEWLDKRDFDHIDGESQEEKRRSLFAEKMREFGFTCEDADHPWHYGTGEPETCPEHYGFCGWAYKGWIERKARELMKKDTAR